MSPRTAPSALSSPYAPLLAATLLLSACGSNDPLPGPVGPAPLPATTVGELGLTPFDVNEQDRVGPAQHSAMYGKPPEIVVVPNGTTLDVLVQDHSEDDLGEPVRRAVLLTLVPDGDDYIVQAAVAPPTLDRIMGLARDEAGNRYIASGIIESEHRELTVNYPAAGQYRENVVLVVKLDGDDQELFNVDLDMARSEMGETPEQIINPMVASSARLAVGGGRVALVHGINTDPDSGGVRHQKAITTHLDASTGAVLRRSSIWVSHSFDQRVMYDGSGFMEMHLGDAYPRYIALARVWEDSSGSYPLFHIKGALGANNTFTRLGDFAMIEDDADYGYLALFSSEHQDGTDPMNDQHSRVAGIRDLAIVRVRSDFETMDRDTDDHLDPAMPDTLDVTSRGDAVTNRLRWLTDLGSEATATHAERPKLVPIGDDEYIVLYEQWALDESDSYVFDGTYGMRIDADGDVEAGPTRLSDSHLPRGDDAFRVGDEAGFMTGDRTAQTLSLHLVTRSLGYREIIIE